ncbi:MAG: magnesium transporter [Dehalococcoidia bacterium]
MADIRRSLMGQRYSTVAEIVICDGCHFAGLLTIEDLLAASDDQLARDLMDTDPPVVAPGVNQEVAAWRAVQRGESSLAVVDADRRFLGMIPPPRLLAVLLREHEEDLARMAGLTRSVASARTASEEPVRQRFLHRIPWLLLGLIGAFVAATIVGTFEQEIEGRVILAFFIPGVVYLADAVGTQTEALMIRGLSVGLSIRRVVWRELLTGLLVGISLAALFFPAAWLLWGQPDVALAVALALLAACSIATLVAMSLPMLFHRIGTDPAFGSGPLATVVQDLLSILIYFVICIALVGAGSTG